MRTYFKRDFNKKQVAYKKRKVSALEIVFYGMMYLFFTGVALIGIIFLFLMLAYYPDSFS